MVTLLFIVGVVLVAMAIIMQWNKTDSTQSIPARVWAAVVLGFSAFGAAIVAFFHSSTPIP